MNKLQALQQMLQTFGASAPIVQLSRTLSGEGS